MSNILFTKIQLRDKTKELEPGQDPDVVFANFLVNLLDVSAVSESYDDTDDGSRNEDQATIVFKTGEQFVIETPYESVAAQWLDLHNEGEPEGPGRDDISRAVIALAEALEEARNAQEHDEDPRSLYFGYQSNIAVAFVEEYGKWRRNALGGKGEIPETERIGIHQIANAGAKRFLNMFINSIKP